ncbi:MAG: DUF2066 domain-containing protein [Halioglobus sp.]
MSFLRKYVIAPFVCLLFVLQAHAVTVRGLNEAEVPVADHSADALAAGSKEALAQVLVKLSGSTEVLRNPVIIGELGRARSYVQQYSYTRDEDVEGDLAARFEFDNAVVTRLLTEAGAPIWTANRPPVLVWLVARDASGTQIVSRDVAPEVMASLQKAFSRRGIPLRSPLFDIEDAAALSVNDAWRLQAAPILAASQRYRVENVLVGRLTSLSSGEWVGDWSYFADTNRIDRSISADSVTSFIGEGAAFVAEDMSNRYAVAATGAVLGGVEMMVSGVSDFADYAVIVSWLEGLELIDHANVESIVGTDIVIRLTARAQSQQLKSIIELNRKLVPVAGAMNVDQLSYQWLK